MPRLRRNERRELINHLVGNCDCETDPMFDPEEDIETLNKMDLEDLRELAFEDDEDLPDEDCDVFNAMPAALMKKMMAKKKGKKKKKYEDGEEDDDMPVGNRRSNIKLQDLPKEWQEDIKLARNQRKQQKDQLIAKITENQQGDEGFSNEELDAMSNDQPRKIASFAGVTSNQEDDDFGTVNNSNSGNAVQRSNFTPPRRLGGHAAPTSNRQKGEKKRTPIPTPTFNWGSDN